MAIKPANRPMMGADKALLIHAAKGLKDGFFILAVRGYFTNTMGAKGRNDRMMYDDAIFQVVIKQGQIIHFKSFTANTDPGGYRKGRGKGSGKGMANLKVGTWSYQLGLHKGQYMAFRQAEAVIVVRDGSPDYEDLGWHGINIHKGGYNKVSSIGCLTIWPDQWPEFIADGRAWMKQMGQKTTQLCLMNWDDPVFLSIASKSVKRLA